MCRIFLPTCLLKRVFIAKMNLHFDFVELSSMVCSLLKTFIYIQHINNGFGGKNSFHIKKM